MSAASPRTAITLTTPVGALPGVGPAKARALERLGVRAVAHLLSHLPHRHERIEAERPIGEIKEGEIVSAQGEVIRTRVSGRGRGKGRFEAILADDSGRLDLVWFNQVYLNNKIRPGMMIRVQGKVGMRGPSLQLANPLWRLVEEGEEESGGTGTEQAGARLRPVYPASEDISSHVIEAVVEGVLDDALALVDDHLPESLRTERAMPRLREAYRMMHRPADEDEVGQARRRLAYDELLMLQLGVQLKRAHARTAFHAPALEWTDQIDARIRGRLPFDLTPAQEGVVEDIVGDLRQSVPATRLIQGDVGSGKTAVALYAMLLATASGHQAAMMAPTELLAEQHFASLSAMLEGARVRIELLTGSMAKAEGDSVRARLREGEIDIVVGTHALLTEAVAFKSLGVVIIDEQHRFGVLQRGGLRQRVDDERSVPHTLVMTATPIPRTLALTVFGDLDISTMRGLPPGRSPIVTSVASRRDRPEVYAQVYERLERGEQAYVVVPAVESETGGALRDVRSTVSELEDGLLEGYRVAGLHGRLKRGTRDHIMGRFRSGLIDVLVATTVIEVGVDVPNATAMVIEDAERFGLAQLHQIRGRVGRGDKAGVCIAVSDAEGEEALARLRAFAATTDGFELAEKDLELRGPGEMFGAAQSGGGGFRCVAFPRDHDLLMMARRDAKAIVEASPSLSGKDEALLRRRLHKRYGAELGLIDVA